MWVHYLILKKYHKTMLVKKCDDLHKFMNECSLFLNDGLVEMGPSWLVIVTLDMFL